jgi:RNA polymerase sigma-70 factor (ECF subfamily)
LLPFAAAVGPVVSRGRASHSAGSGPRSALSSSGRGGGSPPASANAAGAGTDPSEVSGLATRAELSEFLAAVERRAFKQARFAVRNDESALDIVQDAMLRLAEKYGDRPPAELPLLFQRILQNAIRDHFRRSKVRSLWTTLFSALSPSREDADEDPLDTLQSASSEGMPAGPAEQVERGQVLDAIEREIARLPARQREAFLLRYWEELDVAETASVMGCSEGSVKTHCSRATHALAAALKARGIEL